MLKTLKTAIFAAGKSRAAICRDCDVTTQTLWRWIKGQSRIPDYRRERLQRAIGTAGPIDWPTYDAEFDAQEIEPPQPAKILAAGVIERHPRPPARQERPLTPKPTPTPPPSVTAPRKGLLARFLVDDGEDPFQ